MIARTDSVLLAVYPVFYFLIVFLFLCYFTLADKSPLVSLCLVRALCLSASSPPISELSKRAVKLQGACMHKKICCCTLIFHIQHPLSFCYLLWREVRWNNGSFPRISEERPVFSFLILKNGKKNTNHNTKTLALLIKCRTFRLQREPVFRFLRQDNPFSKRWEIKEKKQNFSTVNGAFFKNPRLAQGWRAWGRFPVSGSRFLWFGFFLFFRC